MGDLFAVTGLNILPKSDPCRRMFGLCDLGIDPITSYNNNTPHLSHFKLYVAIYESKLELVRKCLIGVKIVNVSVCVT